MRLPSIPSSVLALLLAASPLAAQWEVREVVDDSTGDRTRFAVAEMIGDDYEGERPYVGLQCDAAGATFYFDTGSTFLDTGGQPLPVRLRVDDGDPGSVTFRTLPLGTGAFRTCCDDVVGDERTALARILTRMREGAVLEVRTNDYIGLLHGLLFPLEGADAALAALDCFPAALAQIDTLGDEGREVAAAAPEGTAPRLINQAEVRRGIVRAYPPELRAAGIGGSVLVHYFVDATGQVQDARVDRSSGYAQLDRAALELGQVMRFSPAREGDQNVGVWVGLTITFEVQ